MRSAYLQFWQRTKKSLILGSPERLTETDHWCSLCSRWKAWTFPENHWFEFPLKSQNFGVMSTNDVGNNKLLSQENIELAWTSWHLPSSTFILSVPEVYWTVILISSARFSKKLLTNAFAVPRCFLQDTLRTCFTICWYLSNRYQMIRNLLCQ